jgi:DNA-binding CsgD family transcriptional regulator
VFPVIAHSTAIMRDGKPSGIRGIIFDVTDQKRAEETLRQRESALEEKTNELKEVNDALRFLLRQRNRDKANMEEEVLSNVRDLVIPYIEKLKQAPIDGKYGTYLKMVESNLNELVSPFAGQLSSKYFRLTPAEIQVAHLIRAGKTTKEIAGILNASHRTIESHRHNIRTKFGLKNRKANLRSCLSSL